MPKVVPNKKVVEDEPTDGSDSSDGARGGTNIIGAAGEARMLLLEKSVKSMNAALGRMADSVC